MPTRDRPDPPADLDRDDKEALAELAELDADRLRAVGRYLEDLAAWRESGTEGESTDDSEATETTDASGDETTGAPDYPEGVPERAAVTVKEIGGTTYYYYQWCDGDRIESKTVQRE